MYNIDTDTHTSTFMHKSYSTVLQGRQTDRQTFISLPTSCCLMVYKNNNYIKKQNTCITQSKVQYIQLIQSMKFM